MKTAEEVAEKFALDLAKAGVLCHADIATPLVPVLTAFAEERVKEAYHDAFARDQKGYFDARAEALEEAAKLAEDCDHAHSCEGPMIAKAIRALKGKL